MINWIKKTMSSWSSRSNTRKIKQKTASSRLFSFSLRILNESRKQKSMRSSLVLGSRLIVKNEPWTNSYARTNLYFLFFPYAVLLLPSNFSVFCSFLRALEVFFAFSSDFGHWCRMHMSFPFIFPNFLVKFCKSSKKMYPPAILLYKTLYLTYGNNCSWRKIARYASSHGPVPKHRQNSLRTHN